MKTPSIASRTPLFLWFAGIALLTPALAFGAAKDACSLMDASDAQSAIGEPVGPPKSEPSSAAGAEGSACKYRSSQGRGLAAKSVSLTVEYSTSDISGDMKGMAENLKSAGFTEVRDIAGVGDAAIWASGSMGRPMGELTVRKGKSVLLVILIGGLPEPAALDHAKALAAKILPKA